MKDWGHIVKTFRANYAKWRHKSGKDVRLKSLSNATFDNSSNEHFQSLLKSLYMRMPKSESHLISVIEQAILSGGRDVSGLYWQTYKLYMLGFDRDLRELLDLACRDNPALYYQHMMGYPQIPSKGEHPSIMFISMYKSGTNYLSSKICASLNLPQVRILTGGWATAEVIPSWLDNFVTYGGVCVQHLRPTETNIKPLIDAGVNKLQVHLRDPRQGFLSAFHFEEKIVAENGKAAEFVLNNLPLGYFDLSLADRLNARIFSPYAKEWGKFVVDWYNARTKYRPLRIQISTYEEMVRDEKAYIEKFARFFELGESFLTKYSTIEGSRQHFRKGKRDEWKEILTPDQSRELMKEIPESIQMEMGWEI
jgi:hypothetical protein